MLKPQKTSKLLSAIDLNILNIFSSKHLSIIDQNGWPIYISEGTLKLLKLSEDEFWNLINKAKQNNPKASLEKVMFNGIPGEEKQAIKARLSAQKNLNTPYSWTTKIKTAEDKILWLSGETIGQINPMDEKATITISLIEDISEHLETKEQLLQQERLLEVTANNTPATIYQFTIDQNQQWKWLYISEGVRKILGLTPKDLYENPQVGMVDIHPDDRPAIFTSLEKSIETGRPFSWNGRLKRPGKPIKWLHCQTSEPIYLKDQKNSILFSGVFVDITPMKKLEAVQQNLIESEALLKLVSQKAPAMIYQFSVDKNGKWSWPFVSDGVTDLVGISHKELLGNPYCITEIIHPDDLPQVEVNINQSKKSMQQFTWTGRMTPKGQATKWIHAKSNPKKGKNGTIIWHGVFVDITPMKNLEIAEKKLLLANKEKEEAIEDIVLKNKFIAELSHELRTPLISINGFSELLLENIAGSINTRQKKYIQSIRTSGAHLLELINKVLDISKTLQEQSSLMTKPTNIRLFLKSFLESVEPLRTKHNHCIQLQIISKINTLMIDQMKFKQVLYNIVHNAIKYSPEKTTISIDVLLENDQLSIRIIDQGIGLTKKQQKMLFKSFSTPHANQVLASRNKPKHGKSKLNLSNKSMTHHDKMSSPSDVSPITEYIKESSSHSTGLGLYLTKILMEAMNGTIEVNSAGPNQGTTVILIFNKVTIVEQVTTK